MLTCAHILRATVAKISVQDKQRIKDFIQRAVYCYCKNNKGETCVARDLFGSINFNWAGMPLYRLYDRHQQNGSSNPVEMAGRDLGWLLLEVLIDDSRTFEIIEGYTHTYRWV